MPLYRETATVNFVLPSVEPQESLPLTSEREFGVFLTINKQSVPASYFRSPVNDEQWREFWRKVRSCNVNRSTDDNAKRDARVVRSVGLSLYQSLSALSPQLKAFLDRAGVPRRLVIQTMRPELHLLPWGALYDMSGSLLASGDLSIVQAWDPFSDALAVTQSRLDLLRVIGLGTNGATSAAVTKTLNESGVITLREADDTASADILHVEAHGDAVTQKIAGTGAASFAQSCGQPKLALLWSCFSSSSNSWGDSPALWLHRNNAVMVLSFQAELHVADASSIAERFYADVFGATASRDPESALVRIRCDKFTNEFSFANWASMTVYLRSPLDMSALPLNGPRTPSSDWDDGVAASWADVADKVHDLQPGNWKQMKMPDGVDAAATLPRSAFGGWRGNVIRLNGVEDPLSDDVLRELGIVSPCVDAKEDESNDAKGVGDAAERLAWFFGQITHYGSPLIVWTNCLPRHLEFLKIVEPDPALSFLMLTATEQADAIRTVPELVDLNRLEEARDRGEELLTEETPADELLSAAYYASVRGEKPGLAERFLKRIGSLQEWLLLAGNLMSRDKKNTLNTAHLEELGGRFIGSEAEGASPSANVVNREEFEQLRKPEDFYRLAMNLAPEQMTPRETARAKHELAYLKQQQGRPGTAELLYRLALDDLSVCDNADAGTMRDSRWRFAISAVLRDFADLLSDREDRLKDASALLKRAMAIQAFHGMELQLGYSETTAARIALTGDHHTRAIKLAVSAANRMEVCENWYGWSEALGILFDSLAETRETARMISLANLAGEKIRAANHGKSHVNRQERMFKFERGRAHWIAGHVAEAREELEGIASDAPEEDKTDMDREIDQLLAFLRVGRAPEPHAP